MLDLARDPAANAAIPAVLMGRAAYRVVRPLGQGGFGVTHLARRESDGREVVIKQLRLDRMDDWKAFDLFEREAKVLEALAHPNIPAFVDHFEVKDARGFTGFALVQEYVAGPTLREIQGRRPPPSASVMRGWLERLLDVCVYLHERHPPVIHRDISPKNVVVRSDGEPVLIDFGTVQNALRSASTISSTSAGTFGYAAPEQLIGRAVPCSDLYGLAMTYLAVATGREPEDLPFAGNRVHVSAALREHDTHPRLALLLEELTDPDPDRRPAFAAEVLTRLRAVPTTAAPPSPAAIVASTDETPKARIEREWRARAERAVRLGRAGAMRFAQVRETESLRECTIDSGGTGALIEIGFKEGNVSTLDLRTYELAPWDTNRFPDVFHPDVAFDDDGKSALFVSFDKGGLITSSATGPKQSWPLRDLPSGLMMKTHDRGAFAVSPDRKILACLDRSEIVMIDLERGGVVQRIPLQDHFATFASRLRFVPDGSAVLLEVTSATWIVDAKGAIQRLEDTRLAIAEDGRTVARAGDSEVVVGVVERWAPFAWHEPPRRVCKVDGRPEHPRFSPDGRLLAFECSERVTVVDVDAASVRFVAGDPYRPGAAFQRVEHVGFSADGRRLLISAQCTIHPLATTRDGSLVVFSLQSGQPLGSIRRIEDGELAYGFTTLGVHGPFGRAGGDGAKARALLLHEDPQAVLGSALDAALDFRDRAAFWGAEVGAGRLPEGQDLGALVEASAGLGHLLPVAVKRASEAVASAPARFGNALGEGSAPGGSALLDALGWLAAKNDAEREVLFADMLEDVIERELAREAAEASAKRPVSSLPMWPWLLAAAVFLAALTFVVVAASS
jgi:predicted Ser/Thr protein kinase